MTSITSEDLDGEMYAKIPGGAIIFSKENRGLFLLSTSFKRRFENFRQEHIK